MGQEGKGKFSWGDLKTGAKTKKKLSAGKNNSFPTWNG